jgi:hypothetical protein
MSPAMKPPFLSGSQFRHLAAVLPRSESIELRNRWDEAVGPRIAARTQVLRLTRGTLLVRATSAAWAQELSLLSSTILSRLTEAGLEVEQLRFRVGDIPLRKDLKKTAKPVTRAPLPEDLKARLSNVEDEALRQSIADAAGLGLGRQRERSRKAR